MTTSDTRPVALITGGTSGIGLATAHHLHEEGYAVVVTGKNPKTIAAAEDELPDDVTVIRADIRHIATAKEVAGEIGSRHGRLDAVFLNAGTGPMQPIEAVDEEAFDYVFDTNVKGQFFTLQAVLPLLREGSSIVLMSALGVELGAPSYAVPTASRGAMLAMVAPLAVELAPRKIRVNAVLPGAIETPAIGKLGLDEASLAAFDDWMKQRILAGRKGTPQEAARLVGFLLSPAANYVNGAQVRIDGGMGVS
jgi:NAD(P)-dependent dehydrogenase (short-subunit alcohol dehydrogenase family)